MRAPPLSLVGPITLVLLGGLGGTVLVQATTEEGSALDGQAIAERVNEAINGCDVVTCDLATFEEVYGPEIQIIVDGEVVAEGPKQLRVGFLHTNNSYRLITPVAEYPTSDGDLYVAQWVEAIGPAHPTGDPILSIMQVRDGKVVRQFDTSLPFSWAVGSAE